MTTQADISDLERMRAQAQFEGLVDIAVYLTREIERRRAMARDGA